CLQHRGKPAVGAKDLHARRIAPPIIATLALVAAGWLVGIFLAGGRGEDQRISIRRKVAAGVPRTRRADADGRVDACYLGIAHLYLGEEHLELLFSLG